MNFTEMTSHIGEVSGPGENYYDGHRYLFPMTACSTAAAPHALIQGTGRNLILIFKLESEDITEFVFRDAVRLHTCMRSKFVVD